ncbi:MAG: hypothetical protein IID54_03050 [Proteobacteria bacterium]|nr:hypothetical protein [Pseudomonadota bacterium]
MLLFASAGVFHHAGIKIPYFAFFAHDSGKRCAEAPFNMLVAMGASAVLCIGIGSAPGLFYALLPYAVEYHPYSLDHVVGQVQLLFLSALAFTVLMRTGLYPPELRSTNLDADWIYRRLGRAVMLSVGRRAEAVWAAVVYHTARGVRAVTDTMYRTCGPDGVLARSWPTGVMAFWTTAMLAAYLVFFYL